MGVTLYGIPNCDTVKKARAWLEANGVACTFHDFRKQGVPEGHLDRWIAEAGCDKLVNRKGTTWRKLDAAVQAGAADAAGARALMLQQPGVIKRPVVEWDARTVTVGFDAQAWSNRLR